MFPKNIHPGLDNVIRSIYICIKVPPMYHQAPNWDLHKSGKHLKENIIRQNLKVSPRGHIGL